MKEIPYQSFSWRTHKKNWRINQPNVCQFELTFGCGLHCKYCYTDCYNRPDYLKKELHTSAIKLILDKVFRSGIIWLCLTGGDPLTRKDFLDIYSYAKHKGFIVTIFTNGYSMTPRIAAYLKKKPPFVIELTLNAVTKKTYERISRVKDSFEKAMAGIELIRENNLQLKIKTQITQDNISELPEIRAFLKKINVEFRPSYDIYARLNHDTAPCQLRIPPEKLVNGGAKKRLPDDDCQLAQSAAGEVVKERLFRCAAGGGDGIHIDPYGNAFLCNLIRKPAVNLLTNDIVDAVKKLLPLARTSVFSTNSRCRGCDLRDVCGWCPGRAYVETGNMEAPINHYCRLAQAIAGREPAVQKVV